jgi:hypothetical protein
MQWMCVNASTPVATHCHFLKAKTVAVIPLGNNEVAFSLAVVPFAAWGGDLHLVGTAAGTCHSPFLYLSSCADDCVDENR